MSKGLECLELIKNDIIKEYGRIPLLEKLHIEVIEKELKALEIILKKGLPLPEQDIIKQSKDYTEYCAEWSWLGKTVNIATQKNREEFNLLKEVLCDESI